MVSKKKDSILNSLSHNIFPISPHNNFKGSHNISLWDMVLDIIHLNSLSVVSEKVKAHSGDLHNDLFDSLARSSHDYNSLPLNFCLSNISFIHYFPLWQNIPIEPNLQISEIYY